MVALLTLVLCGYTIRYQSRVVRNHMRAIAMAGLLLSMLLVVQLAGLGSSPLVMGLVGLGLGLVESWAALFMSNQWTSLVVFGILFVYVALRPLQASSFARRLRLAPA